MTGLILSLFPGIGMLDHAFELEGFTVVRGPDVIWGGDIRTFNPPAGVFDGIIGGDPCQSHSSLANLVRARGQEPSFPDMTPEYRRVVDLAMPAWFLRENTPQAPNIDPAGYDVRSFKLCNSTLDSGDGTGNEQMRKRRFWFGVRAGVAPELRQWIDFALFELPDSVPTVTYRADSGRGDVLERWREKVEVQAVAGDARSVPVAIGGSGRRKATAVSCDGRHGHRVNDGTGGTVEGNFRARKQAPVTGRNEGAVGAPGVDYSPPRRDLAEMCRLQGLPEDWLKHQPWTMSAKRKMIGNGVAIPTGRAIAKAIRCSLEAQQGAA